MSIFSKILMGPSADAEGKTFVFHMSSGASIRAKHVKNVTMTRDNTTGKYTGYSIEWVEDKAPALFTLSITDIIGVWSLED